MWEEDGTWSHNKKFMEPCVGFLTYFAKESIPFYQTVIDSSVRKGFIKRGEVEIRFFDGNPALVLNCPNKDLSDFWAEYDRMRENRNAG